MTADADMLSFNLSQHLLDYRKGEMLKLFNSRVYVNVNETIHTPFLNDTIITQYPMHTIAGSIRTWREIMGNSFR